jgi:hypothetical protein
MKMNCYLHILSLFIDGLTRLVVTLLGRMIRLMVSISSKIFSLPPISRTTLDFTVFCFSVGIGLLGDVVGSHALYDKHMAPSRSQMLSPFCGITKEMMSRGPHIVDMECRETT